MMNSNQLKRGVTFVEVIVVLAVLAVLAIFIAPRLGSAQGYAEDTEASYRVQAGNDMLNAAEAAGADMSGITDAASAAAALSAGIPSGDGSGLTFRLPGFAAGGAVQWDAATNRFVVGP